MWLQVLQFHWSVLRNRLQSSPPSGTFQRQGGQKRGKRQQRVQSEGRLLSIGSLAGTPSPSSQIKLLTFSGDQQPQPRRVLFYCSQKQLVCQQGNMSRNTTYCLWKNIKLFHFCDSFVVCSGMTKSLCKSIMSYLSSCFELYGKTSPREKQHFEIQRNKKIFQIYFARMKIKKQKSETFN